MFNSAFSLKIYSLKIIVFFIYVPVLLNAFCAEPKDKEPKATPRDLQFYGGCFRRDKNEKSQCSNDSADSCDDFCFHNLKIYSLKIYGCRIVPAPSLPHDKIFPTSFTDVLVLISILLLIEEKFTPDFKILAIDLITHETAGTLIIGFYSFHNKKNKG